jgi:NAD(P)-dependent dehydrogenase (short-subunit alcohol dehydrogenase family)
VSDDIFGLKDRVALVTGGSRGLGRAICQAFAERGATVLVVSRKGDACERVAAELTRDTGNVAHGMACHVGRWEECDRLVEEAYATFGRVDILVNNAGLSQLYPTLDAVSEELFDKVVAVNLKGPYRLASLIGTRMAAGSGGSIINVSSVGSIAPSAHELPYAAAKAGLNTLAGGMSRAFAPHVRVNTIMPGAFHTDISSSWDADAFENYARREIPMARGGAPDEIVGAAVYLASDASKYTTGSIVTVDGGMSSSRPAMQ